MDGWLVAWMHLWRSNRAPRTLARSSALIWSEITICSTTCWAIPGKVFCFRSRSMAPETTQTWEGWEVSDGRHLFALSRVYSLLFFFHLCKSVTCRCWIWPQSGAPSCSLSWQFQTLIQIVIICNQWNSFYGGLTYIYHSGIVLEPNSFDSSAQTISLAFTPRWPRKWSFFPVHQEVQHCCHAYLSQKVLQ